MDSLKILINVILDLYQFILLTYIISTFLINFKIIHASTPLVYRIMDILFRLCEPGLRFIRSWLPKWLSNLGAIDISPIIAFMLLGFVRNLLNEYWPVQ